AVEKCVRDRWEAPEPVPHNLHPPLRRRFGLKKKGRLGPWFRFGLLALKSLKGPRGTALDVFGYAAHRREERALIAWYRGLIDQVLRSLTPKNLPLALEIAALPDQIRGYEGIKTANIAKAKIEAAEKLAEMKALTTTLTRGG